MVMENKTITNVQATITRGRPKDAPLVLTIDRVRREICREPSLTDLEIIDFLNACQAEQLDPLRKEILSDKDSGSTGLLRDYRSELSKNSRKQRGLQRSSGRSCGEDKRRFLHLPRGRID